MTPPEAPLDGAGQAARRAPLFAPAAAVALGAAFACGWLGATLLDPPLVLTGAVHLMGCDP